MSTPEGLDTATSTLSSSNPTASIVSTDGADATDPEPFSETEQVLYNAIMATNSISLAACIFAVSTYILLRRKYPRLMSRTSLRLGIAMTCSDAILHVSLLTEVLQVLALTGASLLVRGPHRLFQRPRWFRLRICRRVDVHNAKLSVHVLCLRHCIKHPTRLRAQLRPKGQQANPVLHHTPDSVTPY